MSVADNVRVTDVVVVEVSPLFIETDGLVGAVESEIVRVIESLELADIFPAASLNQTYTVFVPELLLNVKDMLPEYDVVDVTDVQPVADADGVVEVSDV